MFENDSLFQCKGFAITPRARSRSSTNTLKMQRSRRKSQQHIGTTVESPVEGNHHQSGRAGSPFRLATEQEIINNYLKTFTQIHKVVDCQLLLKRRNWNTMKGRRQSMLVKRSDHISRISCTETSEHKPAKSRGFASAKNKYHLPEKFRLSSIKYIV